MVTCTSPAHKHTHTLTSVSYISWSLFQICTNVNSTGIFHPHAWVRGRCLVTTERKKSVNDDQELYLSRAHVSHDHAAHSSLWTWRPLPSTHYLQCTLGSSMHGQLKCHYGIYVRGWKAWPTANITFTMLTKCLEAKQDKLFNTFAVLVTHCITRLICNVWKMITTKTTEIVHCFTVLHLRTGQLFQFLPP